MVHTVLRDRLRFVCYDLGMFDDAYREVFDEEVYRFTPSNDHPYIIDAGANLGLATCYFKSRYPGATVLAFEPDPRMSALFERNVQANGFAGVTLRPAALTGHDGVTRFYGDVESANPHALGNSVREEWGLQQPDSASIEVKTEPLSPHLDRDIDLLKLDIEGAEAEVLGEAAPRLSRVRQIRMEVHQTRQRPGVLAEVERLLRAAGFAMRTTPRPLRELLPAAAIPWFEREHPEIFVLTAGRISIVLGGLPDARVQALLRLHTTKARAETGRGSAHALDVDALTAPGITFWSAWDGETVVAVGALKRLSSAHGEIKSMHTAEAYRRRGVGGAMLRHIIEEARLAGMTRLSLETGSWGYFEAARGFYRRFGFVDCGPFGDYAADPNSVFMTLSLAAD